MPEMSKVEAFSCLVKHQAVKEPIMFLKFGQRRFKGFRESYQFDKKRILVVTKRSYSVFEFEPVKRALYNKLVEEQFDENYEIVYADFLEDLNPKYVLLVINNIRE